MTPLIVMAKYPTPGRVKTRLAAEIGSERAAALYRAFIEDLADRLRRVRGDIDVWWAVWPPDAPFRDVVGPSARCIPQTGTDLGARMASACDRVRPSGPGGVLVIGADMPHVSLTCLRRASVVLAGEADVVLGPAIDGGYYLIGTARPLPSLFEGIPWGTADVLETTRARVRQAGISLVELPTGWDVDDAQGIERLRVLLRDRPGLLPRTCRALRTFE